MHIDEDRVERVLNAYTDECVREAIKTLCPKLKDDILEQVKKQLALEPICWFIGTPELDKQARES